MKIALIKMKSEKMTQLQEEIICKEDLSNQIRNISSKFRRQIALNTKLFRRTDNPKNEVIKGNKERKHHTPIPRRRDPS